VITGFRLGRGGATAALGVIPDLWTFGKVIGGGLPLAAFAGRAEVMEVLAPAGPVYQAGTLSGNPLATAAGTTVLGLLDDAAYRRLETIAAGLAGRLAAAAADVGVPVQVPRFGSLVGVFFADVPVVDYDGARASAETGRYPKLFHHLLGAGVAWAPGAYEVLFPSLAHTDEDLDVTAEAFAEALRRL